MLLSSVTVQAETIIDKSKLSSGILTVTYDGSLDKVIKIKVALGSDSCNYNITSNQPISIPLQMGNGTYKISILQNVTGSTYKMLYSEEITASVTNKEEMFIYSNPNVNFSPGMAAISEYNQFLSDQGSKSDKLKKLYEDIVKNYRYDEGKVAAITNTEYVPNIDNMYRVKSGICYDYAALFGAVLRSQGIPAKLVMGYNPEIAEFHAWNEVYIDGRWLTIDTTYDAAYAQAGLPYSMEKDGSKFKVMKIY